MRLSTCWRAGVAASLVISSVVAAPDQARAADVASVSCAPTPPGTPTTSAPLASFTGITPRRLVDTRTGVGGVQGPVGDGCVLRIDVAEAAVPAEATALALSVTALGSRPGFVSVFPCATGLPATSNLNTRPGGLATPNLVVALPDAGRDVCIFTILAADLVIDLTGWWTTDGPDRFTSIAPVRADDSRTDPGRALVPGDSTREIDLSAIVPAGTTAVVANLTVTEPTGPGFLTAFPCGTDRPVASNLNFLAFESRAVAIVVGVDAARRLCVSSNVSHHVIVDIAGYYSPTPQFGPTASLRSIAGRRLADSRTGEGGWTGKFGPGTVRRLRPADGLPFAPQATAVVLNVIATEAEAGGFLNVYPCDTAMPGTSAVNYTPAGEATNLVTVDLSAGGEVCVFALTRTHVVVDLFGVMTAPDDALVERLSFGVETWPPFTSDGTDYVMYCGDDDVTLGLDLLVGTTARLNGVPVSGGVFTVDAADDTLLTLRLQRDGTSRTHHFRCVPDDFPRLRIERSAVTEPGWYVTLLAAGGNAYGLILDGRGAPVWYKQLGPAAIELKRWSTGRMMYVPALGPRYGVLPDAGYRVISLSGTVVDELIAVDDPSDPGVEYPTDHHDLLPLPGGGFAVIVYPLLAGQDLTVLGDGYLANDVIADNVIQEVDDAGQLVWSWRVSDDFGYDEVTYPVRWGPTPTYAGGEVDPWHINSIDRIDDGSGDYVVSARHLDAVFRVERATGDVAWILGSLPAGAPQKSGAPRLTIVGDPRDGPRRPHDARLDGDVLTMFDNRTDTGQPARAVAYRIDEGAGTATMLWQIETATGLSAPGLGSTRVAADGSVLVSWGAAISPLMEEFTPARQSALRIFQVGGGASYRITKEPPSAFTASVLRATAGGTLE